MGIGLALVLVPTLLFAPPSQLSTGHAMLLALAGICNAVGLRIEYAALRRGKVGVVTAIASTEGVIAAVIAVVAGVHLAVGTAVVLLAVGVGVVAASAHPDPVSESASGMRSALLAVPVALLFGVTLYSTGRVGAEGSPCRWPRGGSCGSRDEPCPWSRPRGPPRSWGS
jgi:hypothetical protein